MLWVLKRRLSAEDKSSLAGKELKREKQVFSGTFNVISIKSFNVGRSLYSCYIGSSQFVQLLSLIFKG